MTLPGGTDPEPDQLSGGLDRWRVLKTSATVLVVGAVAITGVVLANGSGHHSSSRRPTAATATQPTPRSAAAAPVATAKPGSVFLEHLPKCTRTDHHHALTVAFGVTNLATRSLVLLGATPLTNGDGVLQLTGVRLGLGSCAAAGGTDPVRLAPAANAVVAMTFRVGEECPRNTLIAARVTFDTGATGIVHADSSELTNLDGLRFAQC